MTIITNANKESVLPPAGDLKAMNDCGNKNHFYSLNGISDTSPELVFRDLPNQLSVSRNQELQIWYGQDWIDCYEAINNGTTCVDVYAWYAQNQTHAFPAYLEQLRVYKDTEINVNALNM